MAGRAPSGGRSFLHEFVQSNVASGVLLLVAAIVALGWVNSPFGDSYDRLWATELSVGLGEFSLNLSLHKWINEGLMAIFFLVVGLEIKRELLIGELASRQRAMLPVGAATGGALVPALLFLAIVGPDGTEAHGWGVPMATDIAFALGVLAVLGRRVPLALRIFVTALAIVDDLLAVLVIALFYTGTLSLPAILAAAGVIVLLLGANWLGAQRPLVYALLGGVLWLAVLESGIHATVAGVLLAATIPARQRVSEREFVTRARNALEVLGRSSGPTTHDRHESLAELERLTQHAQAPMLRIEHALNRWVAFAIVPIFALANAGVRLVGDLGAVMVEPVVLGIVAGLVIGKQAGITVAAWLVVRSGLAALPHGVTWRHIYAAGWVCGIGFTMSLFIADLAYEGTASLALAKVGILAASLVAGAGGYWLLDYFSRSSEGNRQPA